MERETALDDALDSLHPFAAELATGLTSHAPMVAEALCALGRADALPTWLARYRPLLLPRPTPRAPVEPQAWRDALGRPERTADWMALLAREVACEPWRAVLTRWLARLAPAFASDAVHGAIRTGHAVRALDARETPARRRELGDALGSWAANWQTLPGASDGRPTRPAGEAIASVELQPVVERSFRGSIVSALAGLAGFAPFAPVIGWIDADAEPGPAISDLTCTFARVFLANARDPLTAVVFVHGVTGAAALRSLVPHADAATRRALIRGAWQAGAALYAAFGSRAPDEASPQAPAPSPESLVASAVAHGDEHAIKMVEACLREYRIAPAPLYLHAARHALATLPAPLSPPGASG